MTPLLSREQAAALLGVSVDTFARRVQSEIPSVRIGRQLSRARSVAQGHPHRDVLRIYGEEAESLLARMAKDAELDEEAERLRAAADERAGITRWRRRSKAERRDGR